jgi:small subunit ribosomal protein S5
VSVTSNSNNPSNRPGGGGGGRGQGHGGRGQGRGSGQRRPNRSNNRDGGDGSGDELVEKVVFINRSSKVVKGGRRFSFSALVVTGDQKGRVGVGLGKATEVVESIRKGSEIARRNLETVSLLETTIPHEVRSAYCGARILLRPASEGTGVIAGKTVRAVLDAVGVKNVLSKSLGSSNPANVVKGTIDALKQLRRREEIYKDRGIPVASVEPQATA